MVEIHEAYTPSEQVKWLHDRKRWDANFEPTSKEFPNFAGNSKHHNTQYLEGIGMQGAIYAAIGLGLVMVVILGYVVACCCCSAKRVPRAADTESLLRNATEVKPKRYNRGRVITLVVLSFIVLIFAAATFKPVRSFDDGFNRGLDGVESISNSFKTVEKMLGNATTLLNSVKKPVDEASKEAKDEDLRESLKEFSDNIDGVTHSINDVKGIAGDLHRDIDKTVKNGRHYSNEYAKKFAYAYAGVMCFSITLLLITMIPKYLCACTYKCVGVPTNILFLMVLWIGTGIFLFVGIFFADYCMQPNGNVLKNFQSAHGHDSKASQSVQYYLVCDPSNPNQNITGIAHDLDNLVSKVDSKVVEAYSKVNAKVQSSDNLDKSIKRQFAAANVTVNAVRTTLSHANSLVGCKNVRKPWDSFTVALCKDFISDGVIVLIGLQTTMALLLTVIMMFGWTVCVQHPGQTTKFADSSDGYSVQQDTSGLTAATIETPAHRISYGDGFYGK